MAKKMIDKSVKTEKSSFFRTEPEAADEAPKIFVKPKNIGDVLFSTGAVLVWFVLAVFFVGLSFFFKNGYNSIASYKYIYFITAAKYSIIAGGVFFLLRMCLWGFTAKELLAYKKLMLMDIFMLAFAFFSFLSHIFSSFKGLVLGSSTIASLPAGKASIYTDFTPGTFYGISGWYMGFLTYFMLVALYFIVSRCLVYNKLVYLLPVGAVVVICLWGDLNRYNIVPIDMNYDYAKVQSVFLASLGNINWFSGYTSVLVPLIWGLYISAEKLWKRILYIACMVVTFDMIILNSSDSGYFALAVTMTVLFAYTLTDKKKFMRFLEIAMCFFLVSASVYLQDVVLRTRTSECGHWEPFIGMPSLVMALIVGAVYAGTIFCREWNAKAAKLVRNIFITLVSLTVVGLIAVIIINTGTDGSITQNALFIFNDGWGSGRGITWKLGIQTFQHMNFGKKLIGAGPDSFYYELVSFDDLATKVNDYFGGARLTNAHNEIITLLVNTGLLGTSAFIGIMVVAIKSSFKYAKERPELIGFGLAVISYLANNMFSFQHVINIPFLFIVIGMEGAAIVVYNKGAARLTKKDIKNKMQKGKKSRK